MPIKKAAQAIKQTNEELVILNKKELAVLPGIGKVMQTKLRRNKYDGGI